MSHALLRVVAGASLLSPLIFLDVAAQVSVLPDVTVTGTREKALLNETPAAVGAIAGVTVRQDRPNHPTQIMSQIPGVAVAVTNGEGHTTSIRQPFTTNPVHLFLEDGIPIRSTGFFNHNALYEINIPQAVGIEVTRGPGTALYGSDAIGGVINVLTRDPPRQAEFTLGGDIGSFGWRRLLAGGGNTIGDNAFRGDVNLTHTDGWRDGTKYDWLSGTFRSDRVLGADSVLKAVLAYSKIDQQTGANSPLTLADYTNSPTRNYLPIAYRKVEAFRLSASYDKQWGDTLLTVTPYVHGELSPAERLRVTAGLRFDHLSYSFENRLAGAPIPMPAGVLFPAVRFYGQVNNTDVAFRHTSPKFGATYTLTPETHVFAGYTHGFRAPSEGNLFRPAVGATAAAANAAAASAVTLKPIQADQYEAGLRGKIAALNYDVAIYNLTKRDDLVSQRDPVTTFSTTVNAGKTRHRGIEIGAGLPFARGLRLDSALSYAKHTYEDWVTNAGNFTGKEIEAAPRVMTNTRFTWQPQAAARVQVEWVRLGRYWLDAANTQKYGGHDLFNLRVNWPIAKDIAVNGSIYNLADRRYADSAQVSNNQPVASPGLPRTFHAGLEAKW